MDSYPLFTCVCVNCEKFNFKLGFWVDPITYMLAVWLADCMAVMCPKLFVCITTTTNKQQIDFYTSTHADTLSHTPSDIIT